MVFRLVELDETANDQVETPIVVVVEPDGARAPTRRSHAGFFGHVSECAVTVVVIKDAARILRDVEVWPTISVIITDGNAHSVSIAGNAGACGHVGERAVTVIVIEGIAQRLRRVVEVALAAVDEVDIHPTIVVVVDEGATWTGGFGQVHLTRETGHMPPINSACVTWNLFEGRQILVWRKSVRERAAARS